MISITLIIIPLLSLGTKDPPLIERERLRGNPSMKAFKSKSKSCDYPEVDTNFHNRSRAHQPDDFPRTIVAGTYRRHSAQRDNSFYEPDPSQNGTDHISVGRKDSVATTNGSFSSNGRAVLPKRMRERHDYDRRMQKRQSWPSFNTNPSVFALQPSEDDEDDESSVVLRKKVLRQKVDGLLDLLISDGEQPEGILSASVLGLLPPLACCLKLSPADVNPVCKGQGSGVIDHAAPDHGVLQMADLMKEWGYSILDETPFRMELEKDLVKVHFHVKIKNESLLRRTDSRYAVLEVSVAVGILECFAYVHE